jgi:hypothetical protein
VHCGGPSLIPQRPALSGPAWRLDSFLKRHKIQHVDFLKIAARGADFAVLRSAGDRLLDIGSDPARGYRLTLGQSYAGAARE